MAQIPYLLQKRGVNEKKTSVKESPKPEKKEKANTPPKLLK
jgi:hypothetical protein